MSTDTPRLPFEIDATIDPALVTGRAGVPLVIELFRQLGVAQTIDGEVAIKQRQRGLPPSQLVESLLALWVSGGDRCQDLTTLRKDQALATLLGHPLPAATTVRDFLEAFHVEDGPLWAADPEATIPLESAPLTGLDRANRTLIAGLQRGARVRTATLDVDATLVESGPQLLYHWTNSRGAGQRRVAFLSAGRSLALRACCLLQNTYSSPSWGSPETCPLALSEDLE